MSLITSWEGEIKKEKSDYQICECSSFSRFTRFYKNRQRLEITETVISKQNLDFLDYLVSADVNCFLFTWICFWLSWMLEAVWAKSFEPSDHLDFLNYWRSWAVSWADEQFTTLTFFSYYGSIDSWKTNCSLAWLISFKDVSQEYFQALFCVHYLESIFHRLFF